MLHQPNDKVVRDRANSSGHASNGSPDVRRTSDRCIWHAHSVVYGCVPRRPVGCENAVPPELGKNDGVVQTFIQLGSIACDAAPIEIGVVVPRTDVQRC